MKLKSVVSGLSEACVAELEGLRPRVLAEVLVPHLHTPPNFGPSEFYVQRCDEADSGTHEPFCEVRLSGVTADNGDRAPNDFVRARQALHDICAEVIKRHLDETDAVDAVELSTSIMLDAPIRGSSLVEGEKSLISSS